MKKQLITASLMGLFFSLPVFAEPDADRPSIPLYVGAYSGYGHISGGYKQDGDMVQGRFTLGLHFVEYRRWTLGGEVGIQSGNTMRLSADPAIINAAGGLPIQSTLKPLVDVLFTVKAQIWESQPLFYLLKGGVAYRQLTLNDRSSSRDSLNKINPEIQMGLGFNVTERVVITALYQGIYSHDNAGIKLNHVGDVTLSHIPTEQAGLLGIEYSFS